LVAREVNGVKVILPVWHDIGAADIRAYSPTLADRLAVSSSKGLDHVTDELLRAIRQGRSAGNQLRAITAPTVTPSGSVIASSTDHRELSSYASELHRHCVSQLLSAKGPVAIMDGGAIVMHVVPFSAIGDTPTSAFEAMSREPHKFVPISSSHGRDYRITYDGLLVGSNNEGLSKPQRAYVSVFRTGTIEAVESSLARGREREYSYVVLPQMQATIIKYACNYARTLGSFSVLPPLAVCVSLINVQGTKLLQDFMPYGSIPEDLPCGNLDRNRLDFGQVIFEAIPPNYNEAAKPLRPILTHLANTAGLHSSPYFDAAGNYALVDKL
jgi:hypothetical protein